VLGTGTTVLNLTGAQSSLPSATNTSVCRPFAAAPPAKPQPVTGQAPSTVPRPATQQLQPIMSFQPRLSSQTDFRPVFGQSTQPSVSAGPAFGLAKEKADLPKQPQQFAAIPSTKAFASIPSVPPGLQPAEGFSGNHSSAVSAVKTRVSSLSSQSFNFGPPVGQSTPAPATNRVAAQLRFDTPPPPAATLGGALTTVKTVPVSTAPVAVPKHPSTATAPVRPTAGKFRLNAVYCYPHMPIGKVWIYRLLFVCLFVCMDTDFCAEDKASDVTFCTVVH